MATFYTSLDNQRDILPTLCSGDQKLASFPDSLVQSNDMMMMMYLNQPSSAEPYSMTSIPPTSNTTSYVHLNSPIGDLIGSDNDKNKELRGYESFLLNLSGGNSSTVKAESCNPLMCQYESADTADTILNSKYLTETQHLLNEVVSVQEALKQFDSSKRRNAHASELDASREADERSSSQSMLTTTNGTIPNATESKTNGSAEISPDEMQDLQNKKAKLLSMLDEVDKRYRQYCHQMQMVVSSFDSIAGCGAAKSYTTLARQTISRHFRSLRDAISGQIQEIKKSLGEQETGIPRLRSVDHHIRHHLRMMRHAWRPQRGLPESSVSTLRAWLFEHFLHPYPNDSEKITLARQTGLSRNQVANWFINARVRLWKPMVEEMYKEEFGDSELNSNSLENPPNASKDNYLSCEDGGGFHRDKILRSGAIQLQDDQRPMAKDHRQHDATATEDMAEPNISLGFGDQVSLALGLHRCETDAYPMSSSVGAGTVDYLYVDSGKQQHRFGSPHQLHDFVV